MSNKKEIIIKLNKLNSEKIELEEELKKFNERTDITGVIEFKVKSLNETKQYIILPDKDNKISLTATHFGEYIIPYFSPDFCPTINEASYEKKSIEIIGTPDGIRGTCCYISDLSLNEVHEAFKQKYLTDTKFYPCFHMSNISEISSYIMIIDKENTYCIGCDYGCDYVISENEKEFTIKKQFKNFPDYERINYITKTNQNGIIINMSIKSDIKYRNLNY